MNDTIQYILDAIKNHVWSGFSSPADVDQMIDDLLEKGADEALPRAAVGPEFARKAAAEATWPVTAWTLRSRRSIIAGLSRCRTPATRCRKVTPVGMARG